jgi:glutamate/aspartate transport system substrate-binding protein
VIPRAPFKPDIHTMKASPLLMAPLLLAALAQAQAGPVIDRIRSSGRIVIAHRESSVPLSYLDQNKKPVGYAVDLCLKVAEAVKHKLNLPKLDVAYVMVNGATRIPTIAEGKADLECGSTTNNAERRQKVAFTIPHYITGARYLVRADSQIGELNDFDHHKLASTKGTTPLKAIQQANQERLLGITVVEAPDHAKAVEMVESGEVDGFAMDDVLLYGLRSERKDPNKLKVVGKFLTIEPLAIMLSKDDPEFKRIVDDEMRRLILSREAYAIYDKWFMQPIPPRNVPLHMPMNYLLKDFWKYPTDEVPN